MTLTTNRVDVSPGDVLQVSAAVDNPGLAGIAVDFYLGVVLPDGSTAVAFGPDLTPAVGSVSNLAALPALARAVSLASPFTVSRPALFEYRWTGTEPLGRYLFFVVALRTDGSPGAGEQVGLSTQAVQFAAAPPPDDPSSDMDWRGFADSRTVDSAASALAILQARAPVVCAEGQPGQALPLPDALRNIRAALEQEAGGATLDAFLAGLGDLARVPAVAAAAIADRKPHAALAALLAAHAGEPQDPSHLVNAAGLASLLGLPSEALGLLSAADQLPGEPDSPLGLPGRALALNNRGHALLGLGRWADAEAVLAQAVALAPHLAEARTNLSLALLCQGSATSEARAVRLFRAGRWRTLGSPIPVDSPVAGPRPSVNPTVTIEATRPTATEDPPVPGLLIVSRTGDPAEALTVAYQVSGTATPGTDYGALPGSVTIPAGAFSATIPVSPSPDDLEEPDETVVVTLAPAAGYSVGAAGSATVTIGELLLPAARVRRAVLLSPLDTPSEVPEVFDLSAGVEGRLPTLQYPAHPENTPALRPVYFALNNQFAQRQDARSARLAQILPELNARRQPPLLTFRRIDDIRSAIFTAQVEPGLHGLFVEQEAARREVRAISFEISATISANRIRASREYDACLFPRVIPGCIAQVNDRYFCQPIGATHPRWLGAMERLDAATRAFFGPASRHLTGLAANLADPLQHERAVLEGVENYADFLFYAGLVAEAQFYTLTIVDVFDNNLCTPPEPVEQQEIAAPVVSDPGACPPALTAAKLKVNFLDVLSVAFNCESVELEVAEPGLGLFGQVAFDQRPGQSLQTTIFVGVKGSVSGLGLSAKEGFYLRADSQRLTDAGFKVSVSNLVGAPVGGIKVDSPLNMEFGVAAASQYLAGD